jgi:hypothetical protein
MDYVVLLEDLMGYCFTYFVTTIKPIGLAEIIQRTTFRGTPFENYSREPAQQTSEL